MTPDVVVVGAGPAGSAVSILLARQGYRVLLLDRATFPRDKACAEYLSPACSPILERLGVLPAVLATGPQQLQGMRVTDYRGRSCIGRFVQDGRYLQGLALPRRTLDYLLVQRACDLGVTLWSGCRVRQPLLIGPRVCGVHGTYAGQSVTVSARLVIAADGVHSTLGRRLGVIRRVRWLQHIALVTHYAGVQDCQPFGEMFLIPEGYIGLAPVTAELLNVSLVVRAERLARGHNTPAELLKRMLHAHPELRRRFAQAERVKNVLTIGPMAQRTVCPTQDGILFVGDAAGFFDPFTGQGIYLALHSAELAAAAAQQVLASEKTSAGHVRRYFLAHRQAFRAKYRVSELIQLGLRVPWLANRVIDRLARDPVLANIIVGVAGDFIPPQAVLSWRFARRVLV
jgi:geranylgeranyl reductase family protein